MDSRCRSIWLHRVRARRSRRAMQKPRIRLQCSLGLRRSCWSWRRHCSAMRVIRHQPRGLRQRTCTIFKKMLQHHTHCHHQWIKRRDPESLQAEFAAARWAWLGPRLLVRACEGSEHANNDGLTPGKRHKLSIEPAGKRATLAETGAWIELLRLYVRDLLSRDVDARGDGSHTLQQSTTLKADTMRASDKRDSCNIRAASQILQTSTRTPQNLHTAAEVHSLFAVETDEHEIALIKMRCAVIEQTAAKFSLGEANGQGCRAGGRTWRPRGWRNADIAAIGRSEGGPVTGNQNQDNKCRSHAHVSSCSCSWLIAVSLSNTSTGLCEALG